MANKNQKVLSMALAALMAAGTVSTAAPVANAAAVKASYNYTQFDKYIHVAEVALVNYNQEVVKNNQYVQRYLATAKMYAGRLTGAEKTKATARVNKVAATLQVHVNRNYNYEKGLEYLTKGQAQLEAVGAEEAAKYLVTVNKYIAKLPDGAQKNTLEVKAAEFETAIKGQDEAALKAAAGEKVAALETAVADLTTQAKVDAAKTAKTAADEAVAKLAEADKAAFQTRIDAAQAKITKAEADLAVLKVDSVSAINARQVRIVFSKAIDPSTIIDNAGTSDTSDDNLVNGVVTMTKIGAAPAVGSVDAALATLSADGKVLTLTLAGADYVNGDYLVTISDDVTDIQGKAMEAYKGVVTLDDVTRPTIAAPTYPSNNPNIARFASSEALDGAATNGITAAEIESAMTIKDADGATVSPTGLITVNDDNTFDLNIGGFTTNKNYTVTFAGIGDFAGNLITPNPTTYTVAKTVTDTTAPTIKSVVANSTGKMTITVSEPVQTQAGNVLGAFTVNGGALVNMVKGANATLDSTGTVITVTDAVNLTAGIKSIAISNVEDLSSNVLASAYTKVLSFVTDSTNPTVVGTQVKTIGGVQYLLVQFSENVTPVQNAGATGDLTGTYVDSNSVTKAAVAVPDDAAVIYDTDLDGVSDTVQFALTGNVAAEDFGAYKLTIPSGVVKDAANNSNDAGSVTFTLASTTDTTKPAIVDADSDSSNGYSGIVVQATEDTVTVNFNRNVTAATALNLSNYTVEGRAIFSNAIFDGNRQTVKLTMSAGQIPVSSTYNLKIANVADDNGNVMNSVTTPVAFAENIKPVIKSATLTAANKITVKFSEDVNDANVVVAGAGNDFTVTLNGNADAITDVAKTDNSTYVITLTDGITSLNDAVLLKVLSTNDIVDTATPGNSLATSGTLTVTAQ